MASASPSWPSAWGSIKAVPRGWSPPWQTTDMLRRTKKPAAITWVSQVVTVSRSLLTRLPLREVAKPFLRQLMERTGECAHLAVPGAGESVVYRPGRVTRHLAGQCTGRDDESAALHRSRQDPACFWWSGPAHRSRVFHPSYHHKRRPSAQKPGADPAFKVMQWTTRSSISACAASPFRWSIFAARWLASIGISGPASRMTRERLPELAAIVLEIGKALSKRMIFTH